MVRLFKNGDSMSIETDAESDDVFIAQVSSALSSLIDDGKHAGDWEFQLGYWLKDVIDIACKLRGYKSNVTEYRVITAGTVRPDPADMEIEINDRHKKYKPAS